MATNDAERFHLAQLPFVSAANRGVARCAHSRRQAWAGPCALSAALLFAIFYHSPNFRASVGPGATPFGGDFLQEWVGGYIVRAGDYARFYDLEYARELEHDEGLIGFEWNEHRFLPIVYPPFYYVAVSPLSLLSVRTAAGVWALLMIACLVGAGWLLIWHGRKELPKLSPWLLPASLFFMPLIENLTSSQKGSLCLLILSGTFVLFDRRKPYWAGLVFGLLAFKPQLTLVIAFAMLLSGQWRFVLGGATTGLALGAACLAMGSDVCQQYVAFSTGAADYLHTSGYDLTKSHCLYGFFTLLASGEATVFVKGLALASFLGVGALLYIVLRRGVRPGTPGWAVQFSALVLASVLVSPHLFTYDLTILLLPIFLLGIALARRSSWPANRAVLGWLLALLFAGAGISPLIAKVTSVQLSVLLCLALLVYLAREAVPVENSPHVRLPQLT